mmetsp:Transcript_42743/g.129879  ORF Transcript_42743/g.129879 Transcript_42743/m.129879 type:complete len:345 (+) Transcript_42743:710-1744(+)
MRPSLGRRTPPRRAAEGRRQSTRRSHRGCLGERQHRPGGDQPRIVAQRHGRRRRRASRLRPEEVRQPYLSRGRLSPQFRQSERMDGEHARCRLGDWSLVLRLSPGRLGAAHPHPGRNVRPVRRQSRIGKETIPYLSGADRPRGPGIGGGGEGSGEGRGGGERRNVQDEGLSDRGRGYRRPGVGSDQGSHGQVRSGRRVDRVREVDRRRQRYGSGIVRRAVRFEPSRRRRRGRRVVGFEGGRRGCRRGGPHGKNLLRVRSGEGGRRSGRSHRRDPYADADPDQRDRERRGRGAGRDARNRFVRSYHEIERGRAGDGIVREGDEGVGASGEGMGVRSFLQDAPRVK